MIGGGSATLIKKFYLKYEEQIETATIFLALYYGEPIDE